MFANFDGSLPTRGAWIEIRYQCQPEYTQTVAPHAGSVDRNIALKKYVTILGWSLPTRGAWIEIRNGATLSVLVCCRSPRGERG